MAQFSARDGNLRRGRRGTITCLKDAVTATGEPMKRCNQCKKFLFRKRDGSLQCPNGCNENQRRSAFNTVIEPMKDRRGEAFIFDPWDNVR